MDENSRQFEDMRKSSSKLVIEMEDLKKLFSERFGTPWWISDLTAMADKVID